MISSPIHQPFPHPLTPSMVAMSFYQMDLEQSDIGFTHKEDNICSWPAVHCAHNSSTATRWLTNMVTDQSTSKGYKHCSIPAHAPVSVSNFSWPAMISLQLCNRPENWTSTIFCHHTYAKLLNTSEAHMWTTSCIFDLHLGVKLTIAIICSISLQSPEVHNAADK